MGDIWWVSQIPRNIGAGLERELPRGTQLPMCLWAFNALRRWLVQKLHLSHFFGSKDYDRQTFKEVAVLSHTNNNAKTIKHQEWGKNQHSTCILFSPKIVQNPGSSQTLQDSVSLILCKPSSWLPLKSIQQTVQFCVTLSNFSHCKVQVRYQGF